MADIFEEVEEDLRRDRYERLARKYGGLVIGAALLVVVGTAGYVTWKNWHQAQLQANTLTLAAAIEQAVAVPAAPAASADGAKTSTTEALDRAATTLGQGPGELARFYLAGVRAKAGDTAGALAVYDTIIRDSAVPPLYRDLALLLSVQNQAGSGDPKALSAQLSRLTAESNPWRYSARELTALLTARAGDKAAAATLFHQLADDQGTPAGMRTRASDLAAFYGKSP